jgi:hypothetical protein
MSAMQALKHPWIVKHIGNKEIEDNRQDSASVEVVYDQQSERESVIMIADS